MRLDIYSKYYTKRDVADRGICHFVFIERSLAVPHRVQRLESQETPGRAGGERKLIQTHSKVKTKTMNDKAG